MWSTLAATHLPTAGAVPRFVDAEGTEQDWLVHRWRGEVSPAERRLLAGLVGPVLDIGCGPGRVAAHLARRGIDALGVDVAEAAVMPARRRGATALCASVFDRLPAEGRWAGAVLLDGNLGIGGDPLRLLRRLHGLLRAGGRVLAEADAPGAATRSTRVRLHGSGSTWQPWALVCIDDVGQLAAGAGFRLTATEASEGRWFAQLDV